MTTAEQLELLEQQLRMRTFNIPGMPATNVDHLGNAEEVKQLKSLRQKMVMEKIGTKGFNDLNMQELEQMRSTGLLDETTLNAMIKMQADQQAKAALETKKNELGQKFLNGKSLDALSANERAEYDRRVNDAQSALTQPTDGSPARPTYAYGTNLDGTMLDQYKLGDWKTVTANTDALDKYKATALRDAGTNSAWANMMLSKQGEEEKASLDRAGALQASGYNQALSSLMQTGGLNGGARERMARSSTNMGLLDRQKALRAGTLDRMNIGLEDEKARMGQLENLQGMNNTQADILFKNQEKQLGINQYNTSNALNELNASRGYNLDTWKQQMQTWGANKAADAQAKAAAASGGGKK